MLKLKDKNKKLIAGLINYKDLCIESALSTGDKKLSFSLPKEDKFYNFIEEECYIETKTQEYVIKARDVGVDYTRFDCVLNLEGLEASIFDRFESVEQTITNALNLAIVGTGWTVKDNTLKKKRTVRCTNKNALEIVQEIKKTYRVDIVFNTLKREIEVHEHLGEDKGTYFIDSLNLTALQVQSDSYKFATRIIAEGKDGLSFSDINNGKNYVENYQYSKKVKTLYWKDERYTIKESLLEDARAKLREISKPFISYNASILNLAELNPKYKDILDYRLGDTITLISRNNKVKDKQRIVKTIEYLQDHSRDTVELANAVLKFEDIQQENQETTDTVNNITTDNGTIDGTTIDGIKVKQIEDFKANVVEVVNLKAINASIDNLHANKADIQDLHAVTAKIGTLEATKANITQLNAVNAEISKLNSIKANIVDLNSATAKIGVLESKTASIDNLLAGNLTANNFKTNSIVAGSGIIADGAIGSAQISSLSVNKLEAGDITTSKHKIVSADGTIEIVGNQILINRNNVNRVVLGEYRKKDGTTEYGLLVRAKDGQTVMLDGNGVHNAGITDGAIDNNKVADNANISGNKLDINSVIREVNTHGTETIKGTKVTIGDRTLDVELSTQKNTITEHSKELSSQKATINALDNAIKLKVDSQTFSKATETINGNINKAKQDAINTASTDATNKANNALNSAKTFVNSEINTVNTHLNKNTSEINILKGKIESKVSQTDIDKSISNIQIGGRNILKNSRLIMPYSNNNDYYPIYVTEKTELNKKFYRVTRRREDLRPESFSIYNTIQASEISEEIKDKTLTFSFKARCSHRVESSMMFYFIEKGTGREIRFNVPPIEIDENWRTFSFTITTNFSINSINVFRFTPLQIEIPSGEISNFYLDLCEWKIEVGNKCSDWTPAPEDIDKSITDNIKIVTDKISTVESKLTQENNSIKASVRDLNSTTQSITTNVSNINRDLTSKINSNLDVAKNFATDKANEALNSAKAFVNAEITTVNSKVHNLESGINILKDKIKSKVSQSDVDKSIENIEFGGRNLLTKQNLKDTFKLVGDPTFDYNHEDCKNGFYLVGDKSQKSAIRIPNVIDKNGEYTVSFEFKGSQNVSIGFYIDICDLGTKWFSTTNDNTWKRVTYTVNVTNYTKETYNFIDFSGISWAYIFVRNLKVERGNKATDYTQAPEDLNQSITDNIQVVDTKISDVSSTVTQLKNSVTTEINSINSKTTTLNGKIVNAETRLNSVEAKITDTAIINTVRREFYSKGETDNMYSSKTEVTQLSNSLEWKISTLGAGNLIKNSSFNGGFDCWIKNGNPSLSTNTDFLQDRYGKMISIEGGAREGIFQRFPTIPGEMYTVSFFAESDRQRQLETLIGIEGLNYITLKNKPGFRRWDFTFKATSTQHTFVAYLDQAGKFYLGRVMVTQGSVLQEYREGQGIYSNIARFDVNGFTIESSSSNTRTITDSRGFRVQDISTGENLLEANARGVSAKGGRFYVDGHDGNYTLLWGRDITINGQRALVGTHSHPEPSLQPNKLIVNYNNDFANGVEIGGKLTNNTFPILSALGLVLDANGYIELNNGLIIQYGSVTGIPIKNGNIVDTPVRYRKRFPHACISFLASIDTVDKNNYLASNFNSVSHTNGQEAGWFYAKNLTNDKFGALMDINYIAIGY
ncbi:TPA: phage tail spike protein [Clostridium perfringens]